MVPSPFDLPGPQFLAFFLAYSVAVGAAMVWLTRERLRGGSPIGRSPFGG